MHFQYKTTPTNTMMPVCVVYKQTFVCAQTPFIKMKQEGCQKVMGKATAEGVQTQGMFCHESETECTFSVAFTLEPFKNILQSTIEVYFNS